MHEIPYEFCFYSSDDVDENFVMDAIESVDLGTVRSVTKDANEYHVRMRTITDRYIRLFSTQETVQIEYFIEGRSSHRIPSWTARPM